MVILLGDGLTQLVTESFEKDEFKHLYMWPVSVIVLSWLVFNNTLPVFVGNHVNEINMLIPSVVFSYVKTNENPGDWLLRGK